MTWFVFSLLSIIALASAELLQQHLLNAKQALSERTSAVFTFALQSLFALPIVLASSLRDQLFDIFRPEIFVRVLFVTLLSAIAVIFYFRSFRVKNISFSTIFISGSIIVSTVLGILFFHERISIEKFAGILLIVSAIAYVNFKNASLEKNHAYGLAAAACFGVTYTLDKSIVTHIHPLIYITWAFFLVGAWGFLISSKDVIQSIKNNRISAFVHVALSAAAYFLYNTFTFFAYRFGGEVGKVDAINNSQVFLIILFEFFILGHKQSIAKKIIATVIAMVGVLLLGFVN